MTQQNQLQKAGEREAYQIAADIADLQLSVRSNIKSVSSKSDNEEVREDRGDYE